MIIKGKILLAVILLASAEIKAPPRYKRPSIPTGILLVRYKENLLKLYPCAEKAQWKTDQELSPETLAYLNEKGISVQESTH